MPAIIDITGQTFGRLTVLEFIGRKVGQGSPTLWRCRCICGNEKITSSSQLKCGRTQSCGCFRKDTNQRLRITHGGRKTRLWSIWQGMLYRCRNPNCAAFSNYGARGIKVCDDWRESFAAFRDWALTHGYADTLTMDRIDNDGHYEPNNVRWIPRADQTRNQRSNRAVIRSDGKRFEYIADAAREAGLSTSNIAAAIKRNGTAGGFSWHYE